MANVARTPAWASPQNALFTSLLIILLYTFFAMQMGASLVRCQSGQARQTNQLATYCKDCRSESFLGTQGSAGPAPNVHCTVPLTFHIYFPLIPLIYSFIQGVRATVLAPSYHGVYLHGPLISHSPMNLS